MIRYIFFLALLSFQTTTTAYAVDHYASPSGFATWANSTNINTPCSISDAFGNADSGDTIYLRGGTYTITVPLETANNGESGNVITFENYIGETPHITATNIEAVIQIEHEYVLLKGLTVSMTNIPSGDHGVIEIGADGVSGDYAEINDCIITINSEQGRDNISCIRLQTERADYTYIHDSYINPHYTSDTHKSVGVQFLGSPGARGVRIENCEIKNGDIGIMYKHASENNTSGMGATVKNNYFYNHVRAGVMGNPVYISITNNLFVDAPVDLGENGGGNQGHHNTFSHNTHHAGNCKFTNTNPTSYGALTYNTISNNIFTVESQYAPYSGNTDAHYTTANYNLYITGNAVLEYGTHYSLAGWQSHYSQDADSISGAPTFTGGASPTTIAGYSLSSGSDGYKACADGSDIGADVSLVGVNAGAESSGSIPLLN